MHVFLFASRSKLGPYEIIAMLGAGGMGEVYRARDTRLGRDVAAAANSLAVAADRREMDAFVPREFAGLPMSVQSAASFS